ncbi:hypothetical protein JAAARDRAFT_560833 [Jaapia argillacea MUCL 33604]|uniref:Methyltransferase type 11 domain-containing protein n=1 Tax=Jaapia argillacea MUCL 33604 TaxID=933084 RepID=A0A067Q3M1_9AGAM|nr:hypothetical protein JAAARDRAFT_560833 [Jaapia argillacea MUCL 33604]
MPAIPITVAAVTELPLDYEDEHVHRVYDQIASHFSSTRYKPWPIIAKFLSEIPTGWVGLDSGTGNGKYLPLPLDRPSSIWTIGLDRSRNLLEIARTAGVQGGPREVVWGDVLGQGWRSGSFDYAISIATIHHLSTPERRTLAIQRLLECVSPSHGRVLVYVWAMQQDELSKRAIPAIGDPSSSRVEDPSPKTGVDVFVPWVLASQPQDKKQSEGHSRNLIAKKRAEESVQHDGVGTDAPSQVFNRYYHMFAEGELEELVVRAAQGLGLKVGSHNEGVSEGHTSGVAVVQNGWERSNYFVELRRWQN